MQALSRPRTIPMPKMGVLLLIASEAVFFTLLILAFVFYRESPANRGGPTPFNSLDVASTAIYSGFLYSSSLFVWLAERGHKRGGKRLWKGFLLITIIFGATFLYGEVTEYMKMVQVDHTTPSNDPFSSAFFTLTGFHGLHVFVGLILLSTILLLANRGHFDDGKRAVALESVSYYWHFVDAVWVVIFPTVYLWSLAGH